MNEDPEKIRLSRRDLVVGAVTTAAASAIPQGLTSEPSMKDGDIDIQDWKPVTLEKGQIVRVTGLEHSADAFSKNFNAIRNRIKAAKLVTIEGVGLVGDDVAEIASAIAKDPRLLSNPKRLMDVLLEDHTEFGAFYGAVTGIALLENKRVFEVEAQYGITGELLDNAVSAVGILHLLSKTSQQAPGQALRNAAAVQVLSNLKERFGEHLARAGAQTLQRQLLEFDNKEMLRFAWSLSDWRDLRLAAAIKRMPSLMSEYWRAGESAQVFRGSDHGPALNHYLKTDIEPEVKRLSYPHWEIATALIGTAPKDDIREITKDKIKSLG